MPSCDHKCCTECATNFFSIVITDQNISQAVCPFCREPANLAEDDEVSREQSQSLIFGDKNFATSIDDDAGN